MSILSIRGVERRFAGAKGATVALQATSLEVAENDFITILGPSGCGKSTLLRIVAGLDHPTVGEVLLDGERVRGPGADRGMVFQSYTLFPWLTVLENVCFGLRERRLPRRQQLELADGFIDKVGLRGFEHHYPKQLSGGMQQRALTAMAMSMEPPLILADEPTTALDVTIQAEILRLIRELRDQTGTSFLFISHDLGLVSELCDRIYVMYAGEIVEHGSRADIFGQPRHPYTLGLIRSVPRLRSNPDKLTTIPGRIPRPGEEVAGCRFRPRCPLVDARCEKRPDLREVGANHAARCWMV